MNRSPNEPAKIFKAGPDRGNVILNSTGDAENEFDLYGDAFRRAARALAERLAATPAYDHLDACPVVFLYRHATEVYLKAIHRSGPTIPGFDEARLAQHPLTPLMVPLREVFGEFGWSESFETCRAFVQELDEVDQLSFAFRYPVDKKTGAPLLPHYFVFNVPGFAKKAEAVLDVLYEIFYGMAHRREQAEQWFEDYEEL